MKILAEDFVLQWHEPKAALELFAADNRENYLPKYMSTRDELFLRTWYETI